MNATATPVRVTDAPVYALDVLREQIAPEASNGELAYLSQVAQHLDLDPIAGQVVLIGRYDRRVGRKVHRPIVTAEGRHVIAERTGELVGIDGPEWCGPRLPDGTHTWLDVWDDDEPPHAARAFVYRRDRRPANGTVRWKEFAQRDSQGALFPTWALMPAHMLGKVAVSLALRRAFPGIVPAGVDVDLGDLEYAAGGESGTGNPASPAPAKPRRRKASTSAPADRAEAEAAPITADQRGRIGVLLVERGLETPAEQLEYAAAVLGRDVSDPGKVTAAEAELIIDALLAPAAEAES